MKREEVLSAAQNNKNDMDDMQRRDQQKMLVIGSIAAVILGGVFTIFEALHDGNGSGYIAMANLQLAVCFLAFGIKYRETKKGKISIFAGVFWACTCVCNIIAYFLRELS